MQTPPKQVKSERVGFRFSPKTHASLLRLAARHKTTMTGVIELLIARSK